MKQFLNSQGLLTQTLPELASPSHLLQLYSDMVTLQLFDKKAINLQRTGNMSTFPPSHGQEALFIGMGRAMQATDVFCPYYRDHGTLMLRGVPMQKILSYWGGNEEGSHFGIQNQDMPITVPIASQLLLAAGVAYAIKKRKQTRAVVASCGDGGTSKGDFYESLNLAGVWKLPIVFVINNNQWAISVPQHAQTASTTIAQKSVAAGFEGFQIDGNDVIAVQYYIEQALNKARNGGGPTLIEAITYRLSDHTTADDASRYQDPDQLAQAWQKEPLARLRTYLKEKGHWSAEQEKILTEKNQQRIQQAVQAYLNQAEPEPEDMFDYLYETLPKELVKQRQSLRKTYRVEA